MTDTMSAPSTHLPPFIPGFIATDPFRLRGSSCLTCGASSFPAREFCPGCRREPASIEPVDLPTTGTVLTYTIVRQAPEGVKTPYVLARVILLDGTRLMSTLTCADPKDVAIGSDVELVEATFSTGDARFMGYAFKVAEAVR